MNIKFEETRMKKVTLSADDVKLALRAYIRHVVVPPFDCEMLVSFATYERFDFSMLKDITFAWEDSVTTARQE